MIHVLLISMVFTYLTAVIDVEHIDKREYIRDHSSRWLQRFYFILAMSISGVWEMVVAGLVFTSMFNSMMGVLTNNGFWYLGNTATTDIFLNKYKTLYKIGAITMFVLAIIIMIWQY